MDRDIQEAIEGVLSSIVEQVLWRLTDDELDRDSVMDWITECDGNEAAAIGLKLGQKLEAIEEGAEACDLGDLSFDLSDLRSSLESYAVLSIHRLAESQASTMFDELFDFMDDNGLEPDQMRKDNPLGWMAHRCERDESSDCTVYEYRNVEEPGRHIDMWEFRLSSGDRIWFFDQLDDDN